MAYPAAPASRHKNDAPVREIRTGALAGSAFAAEPDDQSKGAVQPAFSAISRPWVKQLEIMDTSS